MNGQLLPITLDAKNGLAYTEDFAPIRAMLKHEPSLTELVDAIERDALGLIADPLDREGNRQIRENADWVKKCARRLEKIRTEAVADLKREPKLVEDAVRPHLKRLEALAAQVIAPVAEMDARAESLRIYADRPNILTAAPADQLRRELDAAKAWDDSPGKWLERAREAAAVKVGVVEAIEALLAKRKQEEADRLELERLRKEKEDSSKITAIRTAKCVEDAASIIIDELSTNLPIETPFQQAYQDLRAVMAKGLYGDMAAVILAAATAGKIRHVSTHL